MYFLNILLYFVLKTIHFQYTKYYSLKYIMFNFLILNKFKSKFNIFIIFLNNLNKLFNLYKNKKTIIYIYNHKKVNLLFIISLLIFFNSNVFKIKISGNMV